VRVPLQIVEASRQRAQAAESSGNKQANSSSDVHKHDHSGAATAADDDAIDSHTTMHAAAITTEWDGDPGERSYACTHCNYYYYFAIVTLAMKHVSMYLFEEYVLCVSASNSSLLTSADIYYMLLVLYCITQGLWAPVLASSMHHLVSCGALLALYTR
jgi:hypothetical protein